MSFQISAGVVTEERDFSLIVSSVPTSIGAIVGGFSWGPVDEIVLIDNEQKLLDVFGRPNDHNAKDWFCARNYLAYSNDMRVVRVIDSTTPLVNAVDAGTALTVKNYDHFTSIATFGTTKAIAKYPGTLGNSIVVDVASSAAFATWDFAGEFEYAPTATEFAVVVKLGNQVVERFIVALNASARNSDNQPYDLESTINRNSKYVYLIGSNLLSLITGSYEATFTLAGGTDHGSSADIEAERILGWNLFAQAENIDVNFLISGGANETSGKHIVQNVAEVRKDCIGFLSPPQSVVVGTATPVSDITDWVVNDLAVSSSYGVVDGNYKYQYDYYNNKYRWIPLNGDIAGLMARTSYTHDPWWSPAGLNRGVIKNIVKLAFNPSQAQRDELYKNNINPIAGFQGEGIMLYGDKTLLGINSAFSRINVRMLFIILEKAIAKAARAMLFEFNDVFTRTKFVQMVEPFLRDVQARRGIQRHNGADGFCVIADERVNTPQVIDNNEFRALILVKPNRSINFIKLTFAATATGVKFEELAEAIAG